MSALLSDDQRRDLHYWMRLTRTLDDQVRAMWLQGRGVGGTFSQRGHEAISVGAGAALDEDDVVAPMHRDLGCYLLRGMTPERIMGNQLGRAMGVSQGRDANLHGMGDLSLGIIGFISHLPQSLPVALGAAMSFTYRGQPQVAMAFVGDGGTTTGLFHETLNLAAVHRAPFVVIVENNQYAYSTPLAQQMASDLIADKASAHGIRAEVIEGNDVDAVFYAAQDAVDRARDGGGPSLIEAKTMRMLGHAIHDGAEYVPTELLAMWEARDPITLLEGKMLAADLVDGEYLARTQQRCRALVDDAIATAEAADWPDPDTVTDGVYSP